MTTQDTHNAQDKQNTPCTLFFHTRNLTKNIIYSLLYVNM